MTSTPIEQDNDSRLVEECMEQNPDTKSVAGFLPGDGIYRLELKFDIDQLRQALDHCLARTEYVDNDWKHRGFGVLPLTHRPGADAVIPNDLSGRYWMRRDERYVEETFEDYVDESAYSEFDSRFNGTYFETVYMELSQRFPIGRMRILAKDPYNSNSWHRDPEPRLHIPIITNPGSLFIVNHHVTHLPADGSVYFTDTRAYHTAINGGLDSRVHLVAALAFPPVRD